MIGTYSIAQLLANHHPCRMDQDSRRRPSEGTFSSTYAFAHQNSPRNLSSLQPSSNGVMEIVTPEDVDSALRYTPLSSVVPISGGICPFLQKWRQLLLIYVWTVLKVLPSPQVAWFYPSTLVPNPDQETRTQGYFDLMNRTPQNHVQEAFQREEFRNMINLLNQVDTRHM